MKARNAMHAPPAGSPPAHQNLSKRPELPSDAA
jgi:hypothetical protein